MGNYMTGGSINQRLKIPFLANPLSINHSKKEWKSETTTLQWKRHAYVCCFVHASQDPAFLQTVRFKGGCFSFCFSIYKPFEMMMMRRWERFFIFWALHFIFVHWISSPHTTAWVLFNKLECILSEIQKERETSYLIARVLDWELRDECAEFDMNSFFFSLTKPDEFTWILRRRIPWLPFWLSLPL